jgi:RNA polymerase sigma factor (sigma-70 family)
MRESEFDTGQLHDYVDRLRSGDRAAADRLLKAAGRRLELLARRMCGQFPSVRLHAETGDVLQGAMIRLLAALRELRPASTRQFFGLAAVQIRRELLDLARQAANRNRGNVPLADASDAEPTDQTPNPADLELWGRVHEAVEGLPVDEREVVGLVFYHGWTRAQVAELLQVSERTVHRWWQSACRRLKDRLGGDLPTM